MGTKEATDFRKIRLMALMYNLNAKGITEKEVSEVIRQLNSIIKEYPNGEMPLYHMDVYRLDGNTDGVGIEEYFTNGGVTIIEWAKTIRDILPEERLEINRKAVVDLFIHNCLFYLFCFALCFSKSL